MAKVKGVLTMSCFPALEVFPETQAIDLEKFLGWMRKKVVLLPEENAKESQGEFVNLSPASLSFEAYFQRIHFKLKNVECYSGTIAHYLIAVELMGRYLAHCPDEKYSESNLHLLFIVAFLTALGLVIDSSDKFETYAQLFGIPKKLLVKCQAKFLSAIEFDLAFTAELTETLYASYAKYSVDSSDITSPEAEHAFRVGEVQKNLFSENQFVKGRKQQELTANLQFEKELCSFIVKELNKYTGNNSCVVRFFHGKWNRSYLGEVNEIIADLQKPPIDNENKLDKAMEALNEISSRANFTKGHLSKSIAIINCKIKLAEWEPLKNNVCSNA